MVKRELQTVSWCARLWWKIVRVWSISVWAHTILVVEALTNNWTNISLRTSDNSMTSLKCAGMGSSFDVLCSCFVNHSTLGVSIWPIWHKEKELWLHKYYSSNVINLLSQTSKAILRVLITMCVTKTSQRSGTQLLRPCPWPNFPWPKQ